MIKNFLISSLRNLARNLSFSFINIFGLALGITCCLFMILWVWDELNVDSFHHNSDRLYSIYKRRHVDGEIRAGHNTPGLLADEIKLMIPEIEYSSGFGFAWASFTETFQAGNKVLNMSGNFAGADFFKMFSYPLIEGNAETALANLESICISRKMAVVFFGSPSNAMGKTLRFNNQRDFLVTAVFEDVTPSSSLKFDYLLNWKFQLEWVDWYNLWKYSRPSTFITLRKGVDANRVEEKIKHFLDKYDPEQAKEFQLELGLQKFDEIYLHGEFKNGVPADGRIKYVRLFSALALFVLLIACINFMNLSTARSLKRAKEIGVRKVIGASRGLLIGQFTGEALMLSLLATVISLIAVQALLPVFNSITNKQIFLPFGRWQFWAGLTTLSLATGLIAGSYPSLLLSSFQPIRILKGYFRVGEGATTFRKTLVVFQFTISMLLIVGTIVVSQQIDFLQHASSGFDRDNLVVIPMEGSLINNYATIKKEISMLPGVESVTRSSAAPIRVIDHSYDLEWPGKDPAARIEVLHLAVGYNFTRTMNLRILQGRDFSEDFGSDSTAFIINESAAKVIGVADPIGLSLRLFPGIPYGKIIGIVEDFHFASLHQPIQPLIIRYGEAISWGNILVRVERGKTQTAITRLEKVCLRLNPNFPFTFYFADQAYQNYYVSEQVVSKLTVAFSLFAIFISSLGLLGLSMFVIEQREKEIGIRKVLGASLSSLVTLLSRDFLKLVLLAALIAFPISWWAMNTWLHAFAYRISMAWWMFLITGAISLAIAFSTTSFHAIKAGLANPVKSLKNE